MAAQGLRLSLLAQYDDLCRYTKVVTSGSEEQFKTFVEGQLNSVRKWKKIKAENKKLHSKITDLESANGRLETQIKHFKSLLEESNSTRKKIEFEKKCLENTIAAVRDVIFLSDGVVDNHIKEKLAFISSTNKPSVVSSSHLKTIEESVGSLFSLSDLDQTDDDLQSCRRSSNRQGRRSKEKRSSSETRISVKKKKLDETEELLYKINKDSDQQSNSEAISTSPDLPAVSQQIRNLDSANYRFNAYKYDTDSTSESTPVSRQNSLKFVSKNHQFASKKVIKSVKCLACRLNIGYLKQSLKCQSCGITCHPECKSMFSMLCFPISNTPTKGMAGKVSDYTSSSSPMIPPLIVHCVREIESRGMTEEGLYRVSGSKIDIKKLIDKFVSGRIIPSLNEVDVHTLCGAIKTFLLSLSEPLITYKSWRDFAFAANMKDTVQSSYALYGLVRNLPQPNRDTLSFLILHWQKVADSPHCKMDIENLATVLGPTVVRFSTSESIKDANMIEETISQKQVMRGLLSISTASWQSMISVQMFQDVEGTPENLPAPKGRLLGPVYASVQKRKSVTLRKTPLTPRNSKSNNKPPRAYFASPLLK